MFHIRGHYVVILFGAALSSAAVDFTGTLHVRDLFITALHKLAQHILK